MYLLVGGLLVAVLVAVGIFALTQKLGGQVGRYPGVFSGLNEATRPPATDAQTFLLMGTDRQSPVPTTGADAAAPDFVFGEQRSDSIMLATVEPGKPQPASSRFRAIPGWTSPATG